MDNIALAMLSKFKHKAQGRSLSVFFLGGGVGSWESGQTPVVTRRSWSWSVPHRNCVSHAQDLWHFVSKDQEG